MRKEIRIAGTGGMGAVLAGVVVGHAAVVYGGMNAVQSQSYGSEARGTAAKSEVIISDATINYPKVRQSDFFVAMSQDALDIYLKDSKDNSVIILDPDLVEFKGNASDYDVVDVPAMKTADAIGLRLVSNIVMLGALVKKMDLFTLEALEKAVADMVPKKHLETNIRAVRAGADLV